MTTPALPTVSVVGTAQRHVAPDSFVLTAHVAVLGRSSAEVHRLLAARAAELDAAVAVLPVDAVRGRVSSWAEGRPSDGWVANRSVTLTGRDLETTADVAGVLGALAEVSIRGPAWQVDGDNPVHDELQAAAVHEARARAHRYALALGGTLGRLVELSDLGANGSHDGRGTGRRGVATSGSMQRNGGLEDLDLEPQPVELSAAVTARWYLELPG